MARPIELQRVIEMAGGKRALAARLGISPQAVNQWRQVPHLRAKRVAAIIGVPISRIRPDIWPTSGR
jgi:DNA-binding transcriptional regulator YdaS (Cro superfamily)